MKNSILILILAFTFILGSCKTHKQVVKEETHTTIDSTVNLDIKTVDVIKELTDLELLVQERTVISDYTEETVTTTEYSFPDSSGNQSVVRTTVVFRKNNVVENSGTNSESSSSSTILDRTSSTDNSSTDLQTETQTKTVTTTKEKDWTWLVITIILVCSAGPIYLFWKFWPR